MTMKSAVALLLAVCASPATAGPGIDVVFESYVESDWRRSGDTFEMFLYAGDEVIGEGAVVAPDWGVHRNTVTLKDAKWAREDITRMTLSHTGTDSWRYSYMIMQLGDGSWTEPWVNPVSGRISDWVDNNTVTLLPPP